MVPGGWIAADGKTIPVAEIGHQRRTVVGVSWFVECVTGTTDGVAETLRAFGAIRVEVEIMPTDG